MAGVSSHSVQLTQDASLKSFWRKPTLRIFLRQPILSTWAGDETKRNFLIRLSAS